MAGILSSCAKYTPPKVIENRYVPKKDDSAELAAIVRNAISKNKMPLSMGYTNVYPKQVLNKFHLIDKDKDGKKDLVLHTQVEGFPGIATFIDYHPLGSLDIVAMGSKSEDTTVILPLSSSANRIYHGFLKDAVSLIQYDVIGCCNKTFEADFMETFVVPSVVQERNWSRWP